MTRALFAALLPLLPAADRTGAGFTLEQPGKTPLPIPFPIPFLDQITLTPHASLPAHTDAPLTFNRFFHALSEAGANAPQRPAFLPGSAFANSSTPHTLP